MIREEAKLKNIQKTPKPYVGSGMQGDSLPPPPHPVSPQFSDALCFPFGLGLFSQIFPQQSSLKIQLLTITASQGLTQC